MEDVRVYQIQISGLVKENEVASFSPPEWKLEQDVEGNTLFTVCTDQAGLVGLIRHLHGFGFELLSIHRL